MQDSVQETISKRKEEVIHFVKKRSIWIIYACLAVIVYIAVWIRTRNLSGLRDITTGGWTLGPDLDPFLFLRYAKYIVENGSLFAIDTMRYVPLGISTQDFTLHYYSIAWFHKIAEIFGSGSVDQSAAIFPVVMFAFTALAFFALSKKIMSIYFDKNYSSIAALVATLFFSLFPLFVPRTIAGIPEKESSAFLFMFLALYLFMEAWTAESKRKKLIFGVLSGISTALMALIWGAYSYIFYIILPAAFVSFLLGNFEKKHIASFAAWILSALVIMISFSTRYPIGTSFTSLDRGVALALLATVAFYHYVYPKIEHKITKIKYLCKISPRIASTLIFSIALLLLATVTLGPSFILDRFGDIYSSLVRPANSRLIQTVAENRQPYLVEWIGNFGPNIGKIFVLFWILIIGSVLMFFKTLKNFHKKERIILTAFYSLMILSITFSRYSQQSIFNGQSFFSLFVYAGGILAFIGALLFFYFKAERNNDKEKFESIKIGSLIFISFLFIALISARGFIRLVMILVPPASIAVGYLVSSSLTTIASRYKDKEKIVSVIMASILLIAVIFAAANLYSSSKGLAQSYVPSPYTQQWQKSMQWVRDNTSTDAVFGHWWDYGYWVQSMGERATALDGGNAISYWNHLMGRYALTETNMANTYQFLYAHNITHFLIDSTDIGKYSAFSTIGSDATYDRRSWIPTHLKDNSQTTQRKNSTIFVYPGGSSLDQDIRYNLNGSEIFLPEGKAYVAAVVAEIGQDDSIKDVYVVYFFQEKTYQIPLRYYMDGEEGLVDRGKGIDAGVMFYPRVIQNSAGGGDVEPRGALLYLSPRVVKTNLARYYIYGESSPNFKLVHSQPDFVVEILNEQGIDVGDFVFFNEFRGPIKIWEMNYPSNTILNQSYLETDYPDSIRLA